VSVLSTIFGDSGLPVLQDVAGVTVTFEDVSAGTTTTVTAIVREFVGATDPFEDRLYLIDADDLSADPVEGDVVTHGTREWTVIKARDTQTGTWELRCRAPTTNT